MDECHSPEAAALISTLSLEDQVAFSLGRMVMRFAALEAMTRFYLVQLLDLSNEDKERIEAIVGGLSFRKLRETLLAVSRQQIGREDVIAELKRLLGAAAKIEERRNVLTHSSWNYSQLPAEMGREKLHVSSAGAIRSDTEAIRDVAALNKFVAEIDAAALGLSRWYIHRHLGVIPAGA